MSFPIAVTGVMKLHGEARKARGGSASGSEVIALLRFSSPRRKHVTFFFIILFMFSYYISDLDSISSTLCILGISNYVSKMVKYITCT